MTGLSTHTLAAAITLAFGLISGCTLGPDYIGPPSQRVGANFARGADHNHYAVGQPPTPEWWKTLGDPTLDALVDRALANNPDVEVALARVTQARASLRSERAGLLPTADTSLMAAHARLPSYKLDTRAPSTGDPTGLMPGNIKSVSLPSSFNLFSEGFDATWELDVFGGQRRAIEAAMASTEAAQERLADTQLSLVAEVSKAYVNLRSTQLQRTISERAIARQEQQIAVVNRSLQSGAASELDVTRLENQLEQTRAQAEPLTYQLDSYRDELAILVGVAPGMLDVDLRPRSPQTSSIPLPPASIIIGDPTAMIRRRPDIRAAERTLAARQAQIGQAEADRFPKIQLLGIIGIGGSQARDLTHLDDFTAIIAPRLSWNFLDFGRSAASVNQSEGVRDEAQAQYRSSVLSALRDAEDSLSRFSQGRRSVATMARAKQKADRAAELIILRQQGGTATLIDVLDIERQRLSAEQDLTRSKAELTNDFIALHKALGIGLSSNPGNQANSDMASLP